jgi:hypothetical protein
MVTPHPILLFSLSVPTVPRSFFPLKFFKEKTKTRTFLKPLQRGKKVKHISRWFTMPVGKSSDKQGGWVEEMRPGVTLHHIWWKSLKEGPGGLQT